MPGDVVIRPAHSQDWPAIESLLGISHLPLAGARDHLSGFVVAEEDGGVAGCAALERYGRHALLRSVAVDPLRRGSAIGDRLVRHLVERAAWDRIDSIALLTTTAADWFPRFGFERVSRDAVPSALNASEELRGACPASAVAMLLTLR